jgi:hypothetical protein
LDFFGLGALVKSVSSMPTIFFASSILLCITFLQYKYKLYCITHKMILLGIYNHSQKPVFAIDFRRVGSSIFPQSGYGATKFLNPDPMRIWIQKGKFEENFF